MRTVIITGATRGLGLAIARQSLHSNYKVIAVGRNITAELSELLINYPDSIYFEPFDFTNLDKIHDFVNHLMNTYGQLWGLINNAAIGNDGILATMHERDIGQLLKVNVEAPILLTKYSLRSMLPARSGRIVNISSIIASTGFSGLSVYGATKSAMIGFTKSIAREVGKAGITVNAVAPGYMETDMTSSLQGAKLDSVKRRSPLGHLARVDDVANVVAYILSDKAKSITGTTITVDAGSTS